MKNFGRWISISFIALSTQIAPAAKAWAKDKSPLKLTHSVSYTYINTRGNSQTLTRFSDIRAKAEKDGDRFLLDVLARASQMTTGTFSYDRMRAKRHLGNIEDVHKGKDVSLRLVVDYVEEHNKAAETRYKRRRLTTRAHWELTIDGQMERIPSHERLDVTNYQETYIPGDPDIERARLNNKKEFEKNTKQKPHSGLRDEEQSKLLEILKARAHEFRTNTKEAQERDKILDKAAKNFVDAAQVQSAVQPAGHNPQTGISLVNRKPGFLPNVAVVPIVPGNPSSAGNSNLGYPIQRLFVYPQSHPAAATTQASPLEPAPQPQVQDTNSAPEMIIIGEEDL